MAQESGELMEKLVALCKRRGFIFQSSEIYGGINGFWDYGPLGVELKRNIKDAWWADVVRKRDDIVGLDSAIIMNPKVWEASGHVDGFTDPRVDCKQCKARFRLDELPSPAQIDGVISEIAKGSMSVEGAVPALLADSGDNLVRVLQALRKGKIDASAASESLIGRCPKCGGELTEPRQFNLMFKSHAGASEDSASVVYLRPETAQGIFANYRNILDTTRLKLPFGIAQIGKAFRNEINPRNYTFRSREFEQMEIEYFCRPSEADKWYEYWRQARFQWYVDLGLRSERLRLRDHEQDELAHYAKTCADIEYEFPFGVSELEGVANRTDFDLSEHQKFSGRDMTYYDDETKERFIPYVIEPSGGIDRTALAFLCEAYTEDEAPDEHGKMQPRTLMKFHPRLAPVKVAVFPLVKREGMPEVARKIHKDVRASQLACFYDEKGAIGRRYRRQDEAGTPFCVTVDGQTLKDDTVTIRDRDSLVQDRIACAEVVEYVKARIT
ncbi:MAG: glycine--tRNA ligase [Planctomycetota bacterium]